MKTIDTAWVRALTAAGAQEILAALPWVTRVEIARLLRSYASRPVIERCLGDEVRDRVQALSGSALLADAARNALVQFIDKACRPGDL